MACLTEMRLKPPEKADLPGGGEVVGGGVDDLGLKDVAGLLSDPLTKILVVDLDFGNVAGVAGDDGGVTSLGTLDTSHT